ncbi:hypothetical protein CMMCAS03_10000 [Clavibacter michiganensis subsp. michiganensis]|nr:hypothetical protein CMMCAS03_10000 [Clavibacter michiganensis subsp. michiganensis]OUE02294.1 hypothetical protein CMMCAS04_01410 [Clavibacter michiganensis subsp. michiganensis]
MMRSTSSTLRRVEEGTPPSVPPGAAPAPAAMTRSSYTTVSTVPASRSRTATVFAPASMPTTSCRTRTSRRKRAASDSGVCSRSDALSGITPPT